MNAHESRERVKHSVRKYMHTVVKECVDKNTGEVCCTTLAEEAAHHFQREDWLDDPEHWVWELAVDEAEAHERSIEEDCYGEPSYRRR